jgi:PAS domain S-box-containing protein
MTPEAPTPSLTEALRSTEERLAAARRRLDSAMIAGEVGTFEWDIVADRLYGDANFERLFDLALDASGAAPLADFANAIHPEDRPRTLERVARTVATGEPYESEYRIVSGGGERWVIARGKLERDAAGRAVRFAGVLVDITERKRAEAARNDSQAQLERQSRILETVLSSINDFAYTFDRDGRFLFVNKPLLDLWGLKLEDAVGKNFFDLKYPDALAAKLQAQIQQVFDTQRSLSDETSYTSPTGEGGFYEYIFTPVFGPDGRVDVVAGSTRDITGRKRTEEALRAADQRKDEFLATLAHELRNPLAPVRNAANLLRIDNSPASVAWAGEMIGRQVDHLTRLIDDLLDISRVRLNKFELRREPLELAEVVRGAVEAARSAIEERRHELTVELPPAPVRVSGDLVRLSQALVNLLTNAARYTEPGGRISLSVAREDADAVVRVKDTGIGVSSENLPRLFEMFFQADSTLERSQAGLGIGLSLVRRVMELHGGRVEALSDGAGKGSEFVVRLPALEEQGGRAAEPPAAAALERPAPVSHRVLVADDNRDATQSLAALLRLSGNEVHTAHDGLEAVDAAATLRPDAVLIDIQMPKLNGYDACRRIREQPWGKDMLLIAQTGWAQEEDKLRAREAGFDAHLVKPVDLDAVVKLLASLPGR